MTAPARTLPHSRDAEESLLSCILIDGPDVLPKCIAAGIRPKSFYDSKHGALPDGVGP
jgi:replicative DNA helicase